jgi:hypothetical protein
MGWQLIDCSFGVLGFIPLYICYNRVKRVESREPPQATLHHSTENILA